MIKGKFNIIIGAQAGSESKGKLAAFLAQKHHPDVICMAASPNAGHTAYINGTKTVTYHLPVSAAACPTAQILLGPTSVIFLPTFMKELEVLGIDSPDRLSIDPRAVMIRSHYQLVEREKGLLKIGSTNQGVGVARREKLMRNEDITWAENVREIHRFIRPTAPIVNRAMEHGLMVLCEMTQGFDLDLEHGIDPHYCTSKMIHPAMGMAEAGVAPSMVGDVYGVLRPYPIRVNNREGSSGPYAEAKEITWEEVASRCDYPKHLPPLQEITTTTKLLRRVFEFSWERYIKFVQLCRPTAICLQFANYINWQASDVRCWDELPDDVKRWVGFLEGTGRVLVKYIGTGPEMDQMIDLTADGAMDSLGPIR